MATPGREREVKVTPLDIRRKEFKRGMRGYADEEVDVFLDDVADEFERLFQENMELQDRIARMDEQIAGHTQLKNALEKTLVSAQLQADQMIANARKEAELILREAEVKARHIVNDSYGETQRVQQALVQLKHLEEDFRFKFRSLLEGHLKLLADAPITTPHAPAPLPAFEAKIEDTVASTPEAEAAPTPEVAPVAEAAPQSEIESDEEITPAVETEQVGEAEPAPEIVALVEPTPAVDIAPVAAVTYFPEIAPLSEPAPEPEFLLSEDTATEETEAEEAAVAEYVPEDVAVFAGAEAVVEEPTAEVPMGAAAVQAEIEPDADESPEPQGFYFGKRVEPDEDSFFESDPQVKDKSRDFEW
jgi:cell division initiation protein